MHDGTPVTVTTPDGPLSATVLHDQGASVLVVASAPLRGIKRGDRLVVPAQRVARAAL